MAARSYLNWLFSIRPVAAGRMYCARQEKSSLLLHSASG